jgi:thermitase
MLSRKKISKKIAIPILTIECLLIFGASTINLKKDDKRVLGTTAPKVYRALQIPNDTYFNNQWALNKISAPTAWDKTTGSGSTVIAILDTGVVTSHQDLAAKIVPGYDFVGNDNDPNPDPGGGNAVYHGTIVAGAAAGATNNSLGIAAGCWNCKIMPVRVLDNNGSGTSDVVASGIRYAADNGAKIINMSFGYANSLGPDSYMSDAIDYAYSKGVTLVAAAGNDGEGVNYPGAFDKVIAVGALEDNDVPPSWSSHGSELDVMAPGVSVLSTYSYWNDSQYVTNAYGNVSGTSIASPIVSGVIGLAAAKFPNLNNHQLKGIIEANTDKLNGMNGENKTLNYGYGRVNADSVLASDFSVSYPDQNEVIYDRTPTVRGRSLPAKNITLKVDEDTEKNTTSDSLGNWSYNYPSLELGNHCLTVSTKDGDDNDTQKTIYFSISGPTNVYRFWSYQKQHHFYTISSYEKDYVIANYQGTWQYEGIVFSSYPTISDNTLPVYRFWSDSKQGHFYTADEGEKYNVINNMPEWRYEGIAYYVYQSQIFNTKPAYRFWSDSKQGHFYTTDLNEKNYVIDNLPEWRYEGIAYYIPE